MLKIFIEAAYRMILLMFSTYMLFFFKGVAEIFLIPLLMDLDEPYPWFLNKRNCGGAGLWAGIVVSNTYIGNTFSSSVYKVLPIFIVDLIEYLFHKAVNISG